ncbi:histidine kinase [Novosphingobium sp. MMS21-SN21R]|uniref:sensor histidine kinase n=1 Tax=Novosphingobium sp. MMS21-SN21R TaxID=2969298 RepID=UPI0028861A34|nr:histidine kinase [Novosphingobium sp. MMS21-SN21R]MDT0507313.1 histidine kinase [Novosphingobium sp. MMS21-SN21R]
MIATGRAILALSFLLALWLDPAVPVRGVAGGYYLASGYLVWTAVLMIIAWRSWWFDFRLAPLAQGIDIAVFVSAVYFTESPFTEFQSPFLAFAAFLLVAAMVRWNWRATALTAAILLIANFAFGVALYELGIQIDLFRFTRRILYMILLSGILIWLSMSRGTGRAIDFPDPPGLLGERRDGLLDSALDLTASLLGARHVVLAFGGNEEPWVELRRLSMGRITSERAGPDRFEEEWSEAPSAAIFSVSKKRLLMLDGTGVIARSGEVTSSLAGEFCIDEGIVVPVHSATGAGQMLAWECNSLGPDDLRIMHTMAEQIGAALDREEMATLARSAAETGVRHAVARDLHDSVAQFLAGTLFRLEALRRWIREGNDPEGEIDSIKNALRREQGQLRLLIERLRRGEEGNRRTEMADELRDLLNEAGLHWHIETELVMPDKPMPVPVQLSHEIRQLVREAIANAVRHGKCRKVRVELAQESGMLNLRIDDDGTGFPLQPETIRPRSITERVEALGGTFNMQSNNRGARLEIAIRSGEPA